LLGADARPQPSVQRQSKIRRQEMDMEMGWDGMVRDWRWDADSPT